MKTRFAALLLVLTMSVGICGAAFAEEAEAPAADAAELTATQEVLQDGEAPVDQQEQKAPEAKAVDEEVPAADEAQKEADAAEEVPAAPEAEQAQPEAAAKDPAEEAEPAPESAEPAAEEILTGEITQEPAPENVVTDETPAEPAEEPAESEEAVSEEEAAAPAEPAPAEVPSEAAPEETATAETETEPAAAVEEVPAAAEPETEAPEEAPVQVPEAIPEIAIITEELTDVPAEDIVISTIIGEEFSDEEVVFEEALDLAPYVKIEGNVSYGMSGSTVLSIQEKLESLGFMFDVCDGDFGRCTEIAVMLYQAEAGLYCDGIVGNGTVASLNDNGINFQNLVYGMNNEAVKMMQEALIEKGFLNDVADGAFGSLTFAALQKYQESNGLGSSGEADLATLAKLLAGKTLNTSTTLEYGSMGTKVTEVQKMLTSGGYFNSAVDGEFGNMTKNAVILFQAYNGMKPTGVVDDATMEALQNSETAFADLALGSEGTAVSQMQQYLKDMGFLAEVNGVYDDKTVEAVKKFQEKNGLTVDGVANKTTFAKVFDPNANGLVDNKCQMGDNNTSVLKLQQKLIELGFMDSAEDGDFGYHTYAAVCAFQAANGNADPDGRVTNELYKQIMASTEKFNPVGAGSSYTSVYAIQRLLKERRMLDWPDGEYGDLTTEAICSIQRAFRLPETGVIDAETMYYLYSYDTHLENQHDVQGYHSNTEYLIYVDSTANRVYVYKGSIWNWELIHNWSCSAGAPETPTCLGEYVISNRGYSFGDGYSYTCYYYTVFNGPYYFHSTLFKPNSWIVEDDRLGLNLSHGCVRLDVDNAYWLYNNIPSGTKVVVTQ